MRDRAKQTKAWVNTLAMLGCYGAIIAMALMIAWPYAVDFTRWIMGAF